MSSDTPAAAQADEPKPATPQSAKPAPPARARLFGVAALAALTAGGYLYWKLQQQAAQPPALAPYESSETTAITEPPGDLATAPEVTPAAPAVAPEAALGTPPPDTESPAALEIAAPEVAAPTAESVDPVDDAASTAGPPPLAEQALVERLAELEATVAALARSTRGGTGDAGVLAIAEAGDLVALAEQRLQLARDTSGAMAALRLAISRLASGEFPAPRRALLADLAALEAFRDVDVAGLSADLAALAHGALGLRVAGPAPLAATAPPPVEDWRSLLAAVWTSLRGLVEVREADDTRDPLLNPAHAALARQQLALDLSAARIAVLQRDPQALRAALTPAIDALTAGFDVTDPAVAAALTRLRELAEIDLAPPLPSLARSVDALAAAPTATTAPPPPPAAPAETLPWQAPAETVTAPAEETAL